jgi:tRNA threonylcarbamoyladenosine biosynthesis protein TsaB
MTAEDAGPKPDKRSRVETILAVHSSAASLGVAVTHRGEILEERVLPPAREHLERLAPLVGDVLSELLGGVAAIDGFAVASGPGSFSGIRVGMATVKGMALALGKPLLGVSSLEVLAWQGLEAGETGIALIDARRGELFAEAFTRSQEGLRSLGEPRVVAGRDLSRYAAEVSGSLVICLDEGVPDQPICPEHVDGQVRLTPSPTVVAQIAWERFARGAADELHTVVPLYIRKSDAEEKTRG